MNSCVGLALRFPQSEHWGLRLGSAADAISLPKAKPRATGLLFIMPPIRSREVACAQRSRVRHREDALQPLDFSNALFSVHPSQYWAWLLLFAAVIFSLIMAGILLNRRLTAATTA